MLSIVKMPPGIRAILFSLETKNYFYPLTVIIVKGLIAK
jgi:hypothetical protein